MYSHVKQQRVLVLNHPLAFWVSWRSWEIWEDTMRAAVVPAFEEYFCISIISCKVLFHDCSNKSPLSGIFTDAKYIQPYPVRYAYSTLIN